MRGRMHRIPDTAAPRSTVDVPKMSRNDVVIRAENLCKVYRLYARPQDRFLDMFGLLRRRDAYTEHHALVDVNLEVRRGEKVALIGRNGAGKSTLLKLITGVTRPTSGTLQVTEGAHALLQIGAGFHPDFTGRENALAYLAHLGVPASESPARVAEIVDFAELEEYIDQPIKTYSTGMAARLMFAASTVIAPELLILDEILGVGDAYFSQKCFSRISELAADAGTTVLLVSHDTYSAARICKRMIWVDQGRILLDGNSETILRGYEDSIRLQEEARLRRKTVLALSAQGDERRAAALVELTIEDERGHHVQAHVCGISLRGSDGEIASCPVTEEDDGSDAKRSRVVLSETAWGEAETHEGRSGRWLRSWGIHRKAAAVLAVDRDAVQGCAAWRVRIEATLPSRAIVRANVFVDGRALSMPVVRTGPGFVAEEIGPATDVSIGTSVPGVVPRTSGNQGTGLIELRGFRIFDESGRDSRSLEHGRAATFEFDYEIVEPSFEASPDVCLVFFRAGSRDVVSRIMTRELRLSGDRPKGMVRLRVEPLVFGTGRYAVWVFIAREGYFAREQTRFYSVNEDVHTCVADVAEFSVSGDLLASGAAFVGSGVWTASTVG